MEETNKICIRVDNHAATAPPGNENVSEKSATVAYWPESIWIPPATLETQKIQPIKLPGRWETISAPRVAQVGLIRDTTTQKS